VWLRLARAWLRPHPLGSPLPSRRGWGSRAAELRFPLRAGLYPELARSCRFPRTRKFSVVRLVAHRLAHTHGSYHDKMPARTANLTGLPGRFVKKRSKRAIWSGHGMGILQLGARGSLSLSSNTGVCPTQATPL
jgi:hypothetical protein